MLALTYYVRSGKNRSRPRSPTSASSAGSKGGGDGCPDPAKRGSPDMTQGRRSDPAERASSTEGVVSGAIGRVPDTAAGATPKRCAAVRDAAGDLQTARVPAGTLTLQVRCTAAFACPAAPKAVCCHVFVKQVLFVELSIGFCTQAACVDALLLAVRWLMLLM